MHKKILKTLLTSGIFMLIPQLAVAADLGGVDTGTTAWMLISTAMVLLMLAGLVAITPAAGVVQPYGAMILGAASSIICFQALRMKVSLGYDDSLDCFGIHCVGSGMGVLLLAFFIRPSWMKAASSAVGGTWNVWNQFLVQLTGIGATIALAVIGTLIICFVVEKTVGFRLKDSMEIEGLDESQYGEHGYGLITADIR